MRCLRVSLSQSEPLFFPLCFPSPDQFMLGKMRGELLEHNSSFALKVYLCPGPEFLMGENYLGLWEAVIL